MSPKPPWTWRATSALMKRLPKAAISRMVGRLADVDLPGFLRKPIYGTFASITGINRKEIELPLKAYPNLNQFFVRRLKEGSRPVDADPLSIVSPVDGTVAEFGEIIEGKLIQAKGIHYALEDLLGSDLDGAPYVGGRFMTIYLSPKDYHRIHAHVGGDVHEATYVPGALFPVNRPAVACVPDLFVRNERVMASIKHSAGQTIMIAVGALNVGRISTQFDASWHREHGAVSSFKGAKYEHRVYEPAVPVEKGNEFMAFHLGSTVVLIFEAGTVTFSSDLAKNQSLKMGQPIGQFNSKPPA